MKKETLAALYVRCSTSHQDTDIQKKDLTAFCSRRGWMVHRIYEDKGISGSKDKRPALDRLMKDARQCRFQVVVVWRFDRFGRSVAHLVNALNEFRELGIDFVSLNEALDTSTPAGRVLFAVIAAIAEFERSIIVERVKAGVRKAQEAGVRFGRPRKGFDYKRAVALRKEGLSYRQIADRLGVSHTTVLRSIGKG